MTDGMTLARAVREAYDVAEAKGFHEDSTVTFSDRVALIHSEVTEAFESWRHAGRRHIHYTEVDGKPEGSASELADVVIRCFDAAIADIGLTADEFAALIEQKMAYNRTRPHKWAPL